MATKPPSIKCNLCGAPYSSYGHQCKTLKEQAPGPLGSSMGSVTAQMVKSALDEYVQYTVPVSDINTPYSVDLQNALQRIADHINTALNPDERRRPDGEGGLKQ